MVILILNKVSGWLHFVQVLDKLTVRVMDMVLAALEAYPGNRFKVYRRFPGLDRRVVLQGALRHARGRFQL